MLCHDPRISNDRNDKRETTNPVLIAIEHARQAYPQLDVDWEKVAVEADHPEILVDREGREIALYIPSGGA
jgi:hypothetical protein